MNPDSPFIGDRPAPAREVAEIGELIQLCTAGRIYDVERWIQSGKPIYAETYRGRGNRRLHGPLEVAIETNQYGLALLLLANGFPPDSGDESLLVRTLRDRKTEFFDLLLAWGADPLRIDVWTILSTYDADLYEKFWKLGVDFTHDHELARTLSDHSSNRPAYGWTRRHADDPRIARELAIALVHAVAENRERAVALLMWAGADSHRRAPDFRWSRDDDEQYDSAESSAIATAVLYGHGHLLPTLKPKPDRDDFDELWSSICDEFAIDYLAKIKKPSDWSRVLLRNLRRVISSYSRSNDAMRCIEKLTIAHDARLTTIDADEIAWLRRDMLKCRDDSNCRWVLRWMSYAETCDPTVYAELTRTPSMRAKAASVRTFDNRYR
jgi:hypothetical protein